MTRDTASTTHRDSTAAGRTGWTPGQAAYPSPDRGPRWTTGGLVVAALVPALVVLTAFSPLATLAVAVTAVALSGVRTTVTDDTGPPDRTGTTGRD